MNQREYEKIWLDPEMTIDVMMKLKCECKHSMWDHNSDTSDVEGNNQNCLDCKCREFFKEDEFVMYVAKVRKKVKTNAVYKK